MDYAYAARLDGLEGNAIRDIFKLLSNPSIISFAGGNPSPSTFEGGVVARITNDIMAASSSTVLQYGQTEGWPPLRESAVPYLRAMGVNASADTILPVSGGQQGVDLMCKAFINPGDTILVESPTFLGALHTMRTYQARIVPVDMDEQGVIPEALDAAMRRERPKLCYLIPTFQNPTGRTLSLERRAAVTELAARRGVVILEDDPYRDLRYHGEPLPPVQSFDKEGAVVYMTSFSKVIAPGLRVGALVAPPGLLRKLTICKQAADVHTAGLTQAIVDGYLRGGLMPAHVNEICALYRTQLDAMLGMFDIFPEGVTHTTPEGGLFVWCELPEGMDALSMLPKACEAGVAYVPGVHFYPHNGRMNTLRLNFSNASVENIKRGMGILNDVIRKELR